MAGQDDNKGSGNDGSWFLEAVGAVPPAPTPSETVAALESDNTVPDLTQVSPATEHGESHTSFDGSTGTSTSVFEKPRVPQPVRSDNTGEMGTLPPPVASEPPEDAGLSPVLRTKRSFRWPVLAFVVFLIVMAALAAMWLPAALRQDAVIIKQSYADASLALRQQLPLGQSALDMITDPSSTPEELSAMVPVISQLDGASLGLSVTAAEPLPGQLPLFPVAEIAALDPLRDTALINAAQGSDIARRLGQAYVYRTTIPQMLKTGDLPTTADVQVVNELSVLLASSLVEDSAALSDLPTTEVTAALNNAAHVAIERYALWQDEYLTALSEGDEDAAATLVAELDETRAALGVELLTAMGTFRIDVDQQIVELAGDLESFLGVLTR